MNVLNFRSRRIASLLALGAAMFGSSCLAMSDSGPVVFAQAASEQAVSQAGDLQTNLSHRLEWKRARIADRLNVMADRLEIKASQQVAWKSFAAVLMSMADVSVVPRPAANADAATVLRFRAERSGERAQKLAKLAEATAALQTVLTPEQNALLDQMVHRFMAMDGRKHLHGRGPGR